ncbi:hypothetical protein K458DRAFT_145461 [Lentithecium fluviatile CBS 122367]|uniref:Uncharacterized protein n=1 Tax=Lentithecium fluviatile CBS 122367 TaxID=1168545 RepID=A0A6G1II30_9PLEO|nr:hypothetical protein K458DRAFT_145461 [Lentithecium fluviatile CBS 122367]
MCAGGVTLWVSEGSWSGKRRAGTIVETRRRLTQWLSIRNAGIAQTTLSKSKSSVTFAQAPASRYPLLQHHPTRRVQSPSQPKYTVSAPFHHRTATTVASAPPLPSRATDKRTDGDSDKPSHPSNSSSTPLCPTGGETPATLT